MCIAAAGISAPILISYICVLVLYECGIGDDDKCFVFAGRCRETNIILFSVDNVVICFSCDFLFSKQFLMLMYCS